MSYKLFTAAGTDVRLHPTFFLLPAFLVLPDVLKGELQEAAVALGVMLLVFASVIAHEFGHILMGRRLGAATEDIVLTPLGGAAMFRSGFERPRNELLIAIAGPAVNLAVVAMLVALLQVPGLRPAIEGTSAGFVVRTLLIVNGLLMIFNLVPIFPMDGGRILRALLSMLTGRIRATSIAAIIGILLAVLVALVAVVAEMYLTAVIVVVMSLLGYGEARHLKRAAQQVEENSGVSEDGRGNILAGHVSRH